jgi:hypothetical protein
MAQARLQALLGDLTLKQRGWPPPVMRSTVRASSTSDTPPDTNAVQFTNSFFRTTAMK